MVLLLMSVTVRKAHNNVFVLSTRLFFLPARCICRRKTFESHYFFKLLKHVAVYCSRFFKYIFDTEQTCLVKCVDSIVCGCGAPTHLITLLVLFDFNRKTDYLHVTFQTRNRLICLPVRFFFFLIRNKPTNRNDCIEKKYEQ